MNMEKELSYKFLQNIPIGKDLFEGKSQEKIACVIADSIEKEEFQIIGIDGGWGTGKSNLVKIVENKLNEKQNNYKFFIYDVWGHQGDDQRKAILVELTDFITEEKQVRDTNKWKEKLNKLLAKEREITTLNFPYLSIGFIFSLISIIYVPTVNALKDSMTDFLEIEKIYWKFLLITFPICIVLGIYIWNLIKNWIKKNGFLKSFKLSAQETFQIYTDKQKEETKIETISEKEPTVRDFRNWMKDIDTDLNWNNNKLIIVFDNFDRLPKKHIQSIWSSIHIFFSDEKYTNIKVIIPFDRAHIKNAFSEFNNSNNNDSIKTDPTKTSLPKIDFANDYINKTFDIVFRIAPPIMSAWKDFFKKHWNEAFNNTENEEEYIRVEQVYEAHAKTITPREIIAFINEIISIKLIHKNIPEQYIGLFVINKDEILLDPLKAITESKFLKGLEYLYKDSDDFQKYITALSYQIDPENALEVIYRKQLKDSLRNKNTEKFNEISKTNIFSRIILSVIAEFEDFENPILTLKSLNEDANITIQQKQSLWDNIYLKNNIKEKGRENVEVTDGEHTLLTQISSKHKVNWLNKIIDVLLNNTGEFNPVKYAKAIDGLENTIKDNSFSIDIHKLLIPKSIVPRNFLELVKDKKEQYKKYKISTDETELDKYLSEQDIAFFVFYENIDHLQHLKSDFSFNQFTKYIKENIEKNKSNLANLIYLFKALKIVSVSKPKVGILLTDAEIYTFFAQSNQEQDFYYDLVSMRLARGSAYPANYGNYFTGILNTENNSIIEKVSERIEHYINYKDFLLSSVSFTNNLMKAVTQDITKNDYCSNYVDVKSLIQSFEQICKINNLDPQVFITKLTRWENPDFDKGFIESLSNYYIEEVVKNESRLAKDTVDVLISYYDNLSQEEWKNIFEDLMGDLFKRTSIIKYSNWSSYALEALKEVLLSLCRIGDFENEDKLTELLIDFEKAGKDLTNTFKNIRDEFINNRKMDISLFSFFGDWLFKYSSLEEKAGDVMRTIMIASLLDDEACLDKIISNKEKIKLLIEKANQNETSDFKEAIRDRLENDKIKDLAKELGIRKRRAKEEQELDEEETTTK